MTDIANHIETVARAYWGDPNGKLSGATELRFGTNGSKSVDLEKGCWFDHETSLGGGVVDLIRREENLGEKAQVGQILKDKFGLEQTAHNSLGIFSKNGTSYEYYDAQGDLTYVVHRHEPKAFRQRRPDGKGGWINNLRGIDPLPYNLPEVLGRLGEVVFIAEGEKCAEALLGQGLLATTNSGGAGNWKPELNRYFIGRDVIILPDNDDAGRSHAEKVARQLFGIAESVKILDLPQLKHKGDVVDWFASGNKKENLMQLVDGVSAISCLSDLGPEPEAQGDRARVFKTLSIEELLALPEPKALIEEMFTENSFSIIYGAPGSGKSFLAIDMGLSIAAGMPWQGKQVKQGSVLYIAGEGDGGMKLRVQAFEMYHGFSVHPPFRVLPSAVNFNDDQSVEKLLQTVEELRGDFSVIFIDTVARALPGCDENSAADMGRFISACDRLRHGTGSAVIGVHHSGKVSDRGMRGSSALLGAVDTSMVVSASDGLMCLKTEKQKDCVAHPPIYLRMKPFTFDGGSSIVLEQIETGVNGKPPKRPKFGSARNYAAFQSLRNLLIDAKTTKTTVKRWHEAHAGKSPDLTPTKRKDARQALQDKGLVVVDAEMVWINRDVEAEMVPFNGPED